MSALDRFYLTLGLGVGYLAGALQMAFFWWLA